MSPEDQLLVAVVAALSPHRVSELCDWIGGADAPVVRAAAAALAGATRSARLIALRQALWEAGGTSTGGVGTDGCELEPTAPPAALQRLRVRLRREALAARSR